MEKVNALIDFLANCLVSMGEFDKALELYEKVLDIDSTNIYSLTGKGNLNYKLIL